MISFNLFSYLLKWFEKIAFFGKHLSSKLYYRKAEDILNLILSGYTITITNNIGSLFMFSSLVNEFFLTEKELLSLKPVE